MARHLPQSLTELRKISGFGDAKVDRYGQQFLDLILEYSQQHQLSSLIHERSPKKERKEKTGPAKKKGDTHAESFRMYKEGKSVTDIAKERNLTVNTIEGHLAKFVRQGDISIHELVSREKFVLIESALEDFDGISVVPVKQKLGEGISYSEIRLVMASLGITQQHSAD
jgi:uncharacterized protein YpbB